MKLFLHASPLLLLLPFLPSCTTTYYPNGHKSAVLGSNIGHFVLVSGSYKVEMDNVDNSSVHTAVGNTVTKIGASATTLLLGGVIK